VSVRISYRKTFFATSVLTSSNIVSFPEPLKRNESVLFCANKSEIKDVKSEEDIITTPYTKTENDLMVPIANSRGAQDESIVNHITRPHLKLKSEEKQMSTQTVVENDLSSTDHSRPITTPLTALYDSFSDRGSPDHDHEKHKTPSVRPVQGMSVND
jgi:hypothetical protein